MRVRARASVRVRVRVSSRLGRALLSPRSTGGDARIESASVASPSWRRLASGTCSAPPHTWLCRRRMARSSTISSCAAPRLGSSGRSVRKKSKAAAHASAPRALLSAPGQG